MPTKVEIISTNRPVPPPAIATKPNPVMSSGVNDHGGKKGTPPPAAMTKKNKKQDEMDDLKREVSMVSE